ncbi:YhcH/YjgK/YiaL family protein [Parabacteroides sp. OttesenSCG-928-K15]|nr:YhcH/YjgK/YiaL family protein [Parabacteroides sp. OttesenSCG-928-K15]
MIHDSLKNTQWVEGLHPLFKKAFEYILSTDLNSLPDGRYELEGDQMWMTLNTIEGKTKEAAALETHDRFIDIQMPLSGVETIGWKAGGDLAETTKPYSEENDITFFGDQPTTYTTIHPGEFAVYFPEDGHAPGIGEGTIRKVVVKVKL